VGLESGLTLRVAALLVALERDLWMVEGVARQQAVPRLSSAWLMDLALLVLLTSILRTTSLVVALRPVVLASIRE